MNRLKELRKKEKEKQSVLASEIGVSEKTISRWENEESRIPADKAQALADHFGVSVGYLLGFEDKEYRNALAHGTVEPDKKYQALTTKDEAKLIGSYRLLSLENQKRLQDIASNFVENQVYNNPVEMLAILERYKITYGTDEGIEALYQSVQLLIAFTDSNKGG
ncbi:TPA: helix-turn-helix transcriptional regulator [Streptococcus suis]|uniref:helix-turn-helix domain-containing protein n=1 Tax=Streptococcus suis TaxID=1307 RepID=UPI00209B8A01|nr:helix-turn-helix transcriptional regulator [Streptococcus suis]MCO8207819.1 helix-turn-helix transcriptional regulator [Streptococcus suis]MCO8212171.1 helix-turn-helix transcriptional regulator [Streptococcus suis]HEM3492049.1 helix-turn-helix transcriptional regulator [Streptococcus suis]HEM3494340.1 helix-turn-helix transcriptional regulator [Streptococcus suis]